MRILLLFIFILVFLAIGRSQTPKHIKANYKITWQDEFNGKELDKKKWNPGVIGSKRGIGIVKKENWFVDGEGHFVIKATQEDTNYYIGFVQTRQLFEQTYGYFECRAKVNKSIGPSCAFWLLSIPYGKYIGNVDSSGTEIDIMEYRHKNGKQYNYHTVHWDGYGKHHQQKGKKKKVKKTFENDFHTFGVEWTKDRYTFYVDGKKTWRYKKNISHVPQHIILSLEMNGWGGDPKKGTYPDQVMYDWVRVWGRK